MNWDNVSAPESSISLSVKMSTLTCGSPISVAIFDPTMTNGASSSPSSLSWAKTGITAKLTPKPKSAVLRTASFSFSTIAMSARFILGY